MIGEDQCRSCRQSIDVEQLSGENWNAMVKSFSSGYISLVKSYVEKRSPKSITKEFADLVEAETGILHCLLCIQKMIREDGCKTTQRTMQG